MDDETREDICSAIHANVNFELVKKINECVEEKDPKEVLATLSCVLAIRVAASIRTHEDVCACVQELGVYVHDSAHQFLDDLDEAPTMPH